MLACVHSWVPFFKVIQLRAELEGLLEAKAAMEGFLKEEVARLTTECAREASALHYFNGWFQIIVIRS